MKHKHLLTSLFFLIIFKSVSFAQTNPVIGFTIPDTVCVNSTIKITNTSVGASSYYWNFCSAGLNQTPVAQNLGNIGGMLSLPVFIDYVEDNGNYYGFLLNYSPGTLLRLDFGNSLLNIPAVTDLGNFNGIVPDGTGPEGIQVVKNQGNWYAFFVGDAVNLGSPQLAKIEFGTSITNPAPVATNWGNIGNMSQPIDFYMFMDSGNWYGFTANSMSNTITRFSFGNNFNNIPTGVNLGNLGNLKYPTGVYAINDNGFWRLFVCNGGNNGNVMTGTNSSLSRLDFGSSLLNTPTGVNLGNPGGVFQQPRDITIMQSCNETIGFAVNGYSNDIVKLDFNNNLSNTPQISSLGNPSNLDFPHSISKLFRVGSDIYTFIPSVSANTLTRLQFQGCTNSSIPNSSAFTPPPFSYNSPGIYNISLTIDDGLPTQNMLCKQIVVVAPSLTVNNDTIICSGGNAPLVASGAITYNWLPVTGLSNSSIANPIATPKVTTKYFVTGKNNIGCSITDSVNIIINPNCQYGLIMSNDTSICPGQFAQLNAFNANALNYQWTPVTGLSNPNISNPIATPSVTTTYHVSSVVQENTNLVVNGDFEQGDNGFYSDYQYQPPVNTIEGVYYVGTNSNVWNAGMNSCGDHTTGNGNMMMVNGSTTANAIIWSETITVAPNTSYAFSSWLQSLDVVNPAQLQFSINGNVIGNIFNANSNSCIWNRFYTTWNSGNATSATISIINKNTQVQGNDFGLDDIAFAKIDSFYDSVKVRVLPAPVTKKDTITGCGKLIFNGITYTASTTINETIKNIQGCDSINFQHILLVGTNPVTVNNPDLYGCKTVLYKGIIYSKNTTVTDTLKGYIGCDSLIHIQNIIIYPPSTVQNDTISNCGKIIYNGITYTSNTTISDTIKSMAGCDSIIHLHSIIVTGSSPINIVFPVIEGCVSLTYNGINYSANSTLKDTIKTYQGCDSIIHIQPIIVYPSPSARQDSISGCNSVVFKGITYTSNTNINDTIKNNIGCDSIIYNHAIIVYTQSTSTTTGTALSGCGKVIYKGFEYTTDTTFTDTIRNIHGCDSIYQATNINIHLQPALSAKDTTICSGNTATLMASSNGTIQWLGYNTNPIMVSPINDTEYTVTATNNWGCTDTISVKVAVEHFSISLNASLNPVNKGSNLVLQTSSSIPYSIVSWSSNPYTLFTNPIADVQNITADTTTNYKVEASSAIGCIDSAYITVVVIPSPNDILMIPNAFSPNGDGINDTWIIKGINSFPKSKVTVYDRNGQIVYYDYAVSGFNGYSNGHPVPSGTYYYIIKLNDTRYPYTYSGWLEIVR